MDITPARQVTDICNCYSAGVIYVSNGYLSEIETGQKEVNDRLVHLITSNFSVSKHWLLTGKGRMFNTTPEEKLERMTGLFNELYPEYQDFVLRQIDELIELQRIRHEKP